MHKLSSPVEAISEDISSSPSISQEDEEEAILEEQLSTIVIASWLYDTPDLSLRIAISKVDIGYIKSSK